MKALGNKIEKILSTDAETFTIRLRFKDGKSGTISLEHIFSKPRGLSAELLRGNLFDRCFIESGALAWPNGFELCPDAIRRWMNSQIKEARSYH